MNRFSLLTLGVIALLLAFSGFAGDIDSNGLLFAVGGLAFPLLPPIPKKFAANVAPYRFVEATANDGEVDLATGVDAAVMGVVDEHGGTLGQSGAVHVMGVVPIEYGGEVAPGEKLRPDATGRAVVASPGEYFYAVAHEGGDADTIGSGFLCSGSVAVEPGGFEAAFTAAFPPGADGQVLTSDGTGWGSEAP